MSELSALESSSSQEGLIWAGYPQKFTDWLRNEAPKQGLETEKLVLGSALDTITGDDANCFAVGAAGFYNRQEGIMARDKLFIRLDWEAQVPELSDQIRQKISKAKETLEKFDWQSKEGFFEAMNWWTNEVKDYVNQEIAGHPDYQEAQDYYQANATKLNLLFRESHSPRR